jgi:hypothetical protein
VKTIHWTSPKGNAYSFNNPVDIVTNVSRFPKIRQGGTHQDHGSQKDWTNPETRRHVRRYPVLVQDGIISEIWHGEKWQRTLDRHAFSPMFDDGQRHYYIDEPARMNDGTLVIPLRWFEDNSGGVWFTAWRVRIDDQVSFCHLTLDSR